MAATAWWRPAAVGLLVLLGIVGLSGRETHIAPSGASPDSRLAATTLGSPFAGLLQPAQATAAPPADARGRVGEAYAKLPVSFVPNAGQTDESVRYQAQGAGFSFFFTDRKVTLAFENGDRGHALEMRFVGASPDARLVAGDRVAGTASYLTGSENHANLPTYHQLVYRDLWPGIDMAFSGAAGKLKYEFRLRPGADPGDIRLAYAGAGQLAVGAGGALLVDTPLGTLKDARPQSFQRIDGRRVPVDSRYALAGGSYGFSVGRYDEGQPLVIDPSLAYSSYLGGSAFDEGLGIAVDSAGAAYVTGRTDGAEFPTTPGAFDTSANGRADAFVTKLNPAGSSLAYSTYLGGTASFDESFGIAVDSAGAAYVTGHADNADFPTTPGAFDTSHSGPNEFNAFITKLNPAGSSLAYSTFLGELSEGASIAVDSAGAAYVTGRTFGGDFPTTPAAFDTSYNGGSEDAFVTKLNPAGSGLSYSTFLGGSSSVDFGSGIEVDSAGAAYVTGGSGSADFPTTPGAFDTSLNGPDHDVFVSKLDPAGSGLAYSTFLGGSGADDGSDIAVDSAGAAYLTGTTDSTDFTTTPGAFDTSYNGGSSDGFATKLNAAGSGLAYSTYLGGDGFELPHGIAVDSSGAAYVTGGTGAADFPTTPDALDTSYNGGSRDVFVTKLEPAGAGLAYSTFLGGALFDSGGGIAIDSAGAFYVTGDTQSAEFPTTTGAFDSSYNGTGDVFVTKVSFAVPPGPPATLTLSPEAATNVVDTQHCVTAAVMDGSANPTPGVTVRFSVTGSVNTSGSPMTDADGQASFCYQGPQLPGTDSITAFADTDTDSSQDPGEPSDTASKVWKLPATTPRCKVIDAGLITAANGDHAIFGGVAQSDGAGTVKGEQVYQDLGPAQRQTVKSIKILALVCAATPKQARIFGTAKIQGSGTHPFRIDVQDLGPPFAGKDTYRIRLDTGYDSGVQKVKAGDVLIHQG